MPDASHLAAIDTILAILVTFILAGRVATLRGKYKIEAPATIGHPAFERACRTHMNTVENLVLFLPLLWLATVFYGGTIPFWIGLGWIAGRAIYAVGYAQANTQMRGPGALLGIACLVGLAVLAVIGLS
jgi:glutathione S-transferase